MARRRKKNPLLTRILIISIAAHAIALPILARYGAFDKIKESMGPARVVLVDAKDEPDKAKSEPKKKAVKTKTQARGPKAVSKPGHLLPANPNKPTVVASNTGAGDGTGPAIEQGSGNAGAVPNPTPPATNPNATPPGTPNPGPTKPTVAPVSPPPVPAKPVVEPPAAPVAKAFVEAEATYQPQPVIPDDLRNEPLEKTLVAELTVGIDGRPTGIKISSSTGIDELDDVGIQTLRQWKFKVATLGGQPTPSPVRVRIEFKVE